MSEQEVTYASPREEREARVADGDVDWFLDHAASYQDQGTGLVAIALLLRDTRDTLVRIAETLEKFSYRQESS